MTYSCPGCGKELSEEKYINGTCPSCHKLFEPQQRNLAERKNDLPLYVDIPKKNINSVVETVSARNMGKTIKETKCICTQCGHIWFYGKQEVLESTGNAMANCGKSMMCCGGCMPAILIPDKKVVDLNKCPKCGSMAIKKEMATYEV